MCIESMLNDEQMMIGMWVWQDRIQRLGAKTVVSLCARAGVTDLFFLTKGLAGLTACRSHLAPAACDRDLLQELLDESHERGIRVHAWFTSASDAHYKQLHPESGRCHFVRGRDRELISLADEGYLHYMEELIQDICRRYEVDGLHLDYIRYNHLLYGWADDDLTRYRAEGADTFLLRTMMQRMFYDASGDPELLFNAWRSGNESARALARARRKDVVRFAKALTGAARAERSGLILSAALMPEGAYQDTAFADLHYGQHYDDMAKLFDYALPMAYSQAYAKDSQWVRKVAEGTLKSGMKTLVGLHAYEGGTGISLQQDIGALKDTPVEGFCLFREGASALAFADAERLTVYNPLNEAITRITRESGGETLTWDCRIEPATAVTFDCKGIPERLRVFADDEERCVYLTKEA